MGGGAALGDGGEGGGHVIEGGAALDPEQKLLERDATARVDTALAQLVGERGLS